MTDQPGLFDATDRQVSPDAVGSAQSDLSPSDEASTDFLIREGEAPAELGYREGEAPAEPLATSHVTPIRHPRTKTAPASAGMCVLASGSSGNCTVLRMAGHTFLIDAGLNPKITRERLAQVGLTPGDIDAVFLTHLDRDHCQPTWITPWCEHQTHIYVHTWYHREFLHLDKAYQLQHAGLLHRYEHGSFEPLAGLTVDTIPLAHDQKGATGFVFRTPQHRVGYATDLGRVPEALLKAFTRHGDLSILAIESNYDPHMQKASSRPAYLKHRIMGGKGHLSNEQALDAVRHLFDHAQNGGPGQVVLLHRSRQCNCVTIVERVFASEPHIWERTLIAEQRRRTPWLSLDGRHAAQREQMQLGFGLGA